MNKVFVCGFLGQDPEVKTLDSGATVTKFSVATNEKWVKDGEKKEKTEWHNVVVWSKLAELCGQYLSKGRQVIVEGKLQTSTWEVEGVKKYKTEIVANNVQFLGGQPTETGRNPNSSKITEGLPNFATGIDSNEELPF